MITVYALMFYLGSSTGLQTIEVYTKLDSCEKVREYMVKRHSHSDYQWTCLPVERPAVTESHK